MPIQIPEDEATLRELFPIKLVGGFIAVDHHIGCVGCRWCLSRRHGLWRAAFDLGLSALSGAFDSPEQAIELLGLCRAFSEARVPLRFGHNTDASLQWRFGEALYRHTPEENPFIFMTRFSLTENRAALFQGQPNLLCKLSAPPRSRLLESGEDPFAALESVRGLPRNNLYVLIGPLAADSVEEARSMLRSLPPGTWADVKPLTRAGIGTVRDIPLPSEQEVADLREEGRDLGLVITDYFGCQLRRQLNRRFYKFGDSPPYVAAACRECTGLRNCRTRSPSEISMREDRIRAAAKNIGLGLGRATPAGEGATRFESEQPASRGDETFLSELLDHRVMLSSVPDGSQGGSFSIEHEAVTERWDRVGMMPASRLRELARRALQRLSEGGNE